MKCALWLACVAVTTSGYQPLASPRLAARRRSALVVLQEQPETDAADENAMEPEGGWGVDNLMEMMETAESEAAPAAAPAPPAAPPVEESSYLAREKGKYAGASGASAGDGDGETRLAVPSFFGKREEEKPGAARGKEGLNEQGYDPYDPFGGRFVPRPTPCPPSSRSPWRLSPSAEAVALATDDELWREAGMACGLVGEGDPLPPRR